MLFDANPKNSNSRFRIQPGDSTQPGQRGRPGNPSQKDHQQVKHQHALNRDHTKRLSSTLTITRFARASIHFRPRRSQTRHRFVRPWFPSGLWPRSLFASPRNPLHHPDLFGSLVPSPLQDAEALRRGGFCDRHDHPGRLSLDRVMIARLLEEPLLAHAVIILRRCGGQISSLIL